MGQHCAETTCRKLDYLPMKCDACVKLFCSDHLMYDDHNCDSKYKKDVQVPVCPLCNAPVPIQRGAVPDLAVSNHIDQACKESQKEKVYTNRCNKPKCKKKELIKCICDSCHLNFCLAHRHPTDHQCSRTRSTAAGNNSSKAAAAAMARAETQSTQTRITNFFSGPFRTTEAVSAPRERPRPTAANAARAVAMPSGMSEDEALAAALAASMADVPATPAQPTRLDGLSQEDEDRLMAQALQESEREAALLQPRNQHQAADSKNCTVS